MKPIPVSSITFTNSVHVGKDEKQFFRASEGKHNNFEITIMDMYVHIKCLKTGDISWAPLFNVKWFKQLAVEGDAIGRNDAPEAPKPKAKKEVKL